MWEKSTSKIKIAALLPLHQMKKWATISCHRRPQAPRPAVAVGHCPASITTSCRPITAVARRPALAAMAMAMATATVPRLVEAVALTATT